MQSLGASPCETVGSDARELSGAVRVIRDSAEQAVILRNARQNLEKHPGVTVRFVGVRPCCEANLQGSALSTLHLE